MKRFGTGTNARRDKYRSPHQASSQIVYKRKFRWADFCIYCGDPAQCLDHVMPIALTAGIDTTRPGVRKECKQGLNMIPSCLECNRLAGNKKFLLIADKRIYIQEKLKKRYKKALKDIIWDDDEISEMGYNIKTKIISTQSKRAWIELRTTWPNSRTIVPLEDRNGFYASRGGRRRAA